MVSVFCDKILNVLRKANFTFPWVLLLYNQSSSQGPLALWSVGECMERLYDNRIK